MQCVPPALLPLLLVLVRILLQKLRLQQQQLLQQQGVERSARLAVTLRQQQLLGVVAIAVVVRVAGRACAGCLLPR
jgi:hypothetical protein